MILLDWMMHVCHDQSFSRQTLLLALNLVDMCLLKRQQAKSTLQLLGITCLFIAYKLEETDNYHFTASFFHRFVD